MSFKVLPPGLVTAIGKIGDRVLAWLCPAARLCCRNLRRLLKKATRVWSGPPLPLQQDLALRLRIAEQTQGLHVFVLETDAPA